ncbi:MAG: phage minor head protein [Flavobacteriaceae bacterium]
MFKKVLNAGKKAFKHLQEKGSYKPEDINEKPYRDLIQATYDVFNTSITDNVISPTLKRALQNDAFLFGGLKTHAQLTEGFSLIKNEKVKSFTELEHELDKLNNNYNRNYLEAEYQFAVQSSLSADQWERSSDRYNLQYRTASDDRVRDEHRVLHGTTLPKDDAFWSEYYPPNGWRCRCRAIQVRKEKYEQSNSEQALQKGQKATTQIGKDGKNRLEIFRFNPGMSLKLMPPQHPYNKVQGANNIKENIKTVFRPEAINEYEKQLNVTIDDDIFKGLKKETPLYFTDPKKYNKTSGAYYSPKDNFVKIPIDERRKRSPWYSKAVVYHEFGHAIDFQTGMRTSSEVKELMGRYKKIFSKENGFAGIQRQLNLKMNEAYKLRDNDLIEKIGACNDVLMSLNINYGSGHTKQYFRQKGNSEAEFIAHAFENRFAKNEIYKEVMPELYDDSVKLINDWLGLQE